MRITLEQYPGLTQNLVTIGLVDLTDNDPEVLARLIILLETALTNASRALTAIGDAEEQQL